MRTRNTPAVGGRPVRAGWGLAAAAVALWAAAGRAESPPPAAGTTGAAAVARVAPLGGPVPAAGATPSGVRNAGGPGWWDGGVIQASGLAGGCASCGTAGGPPAGPGILGWGKHPADACALGACGDEGCGEAGCYPGRPPCCTCEGQSRFGRFFCAFHNALCCPDPCYEPRWRCAPNAALFVDYARPATVTRIRWDAGRNLIDPDRSEFFWAAQGRKGPGRLVPQPPAGQPRLPEPRAVVRPETSVDYDELRLYQEAGADRFSFFIDMPYRSLEGERFGGAGGFGDMVLGTKSLLLDSEMLQFTFQVATSIPIGLSGRGLGVGHVSIDPSLLWACKLYPDTWWQSQIGYWIPISGTSVDFPFNGGTRSSPFTGGVLHTHNSLNHVLARPLPDVALVGSMEAVTHTFTAGLVTDPVTGIPVSANDTTYLTFGPGFRLCICDKVDFGFGIQFAVTDSHFAERLYRTELRIKY